MKTIVRLGEAFVAKALSVGGDVSAYPCDEPVKTPAPARVDTFREPVVLFDHPFTPDVGLMRRVAARTRTFALLYDVCSHGQAGRVCLACEVDR